MMFDGRAPPVTPCPLVLMEMWGYPTSEYNSLFDFNSNENEKLVIDIPHINSRVLEKARKDIRKNVNEKINKIWEIHQKILNECITQRVKQICSERNLKMVENQRRAFEVDDSAQHRVTELPQLRKSHETEAKVLIFHTNDVRQKYATGISQVLHKSALFLQETRKMEVGLNDPKSAAQLSKQRKEFEYLARGTINIY